MPDVFLYAPEPNPNDIVLSDPTGLRVSNQTFAYSGSIAARAGVGRVEAISELTPHGVPGPYTGPITGNAWSVVWNPPEVIDAAATISATQKIAVAYQGRVDAGSVLAGAWTIVANPQELLVAQSAIAAAETVVKAWLGAIPAQSTIAGTYALTGVATYTYAGAVNAVSTSAAALKAIAVVPVSVTATASPAISLKALSVIVGSIPAGSTVASAYSFAAGGPQSFAYLGEIAAQATVIGQYAGPAPVTPISEPVGFPWWLRELKRQPATFVYAGLIEAHAYISARVITNIVEFSDDDLLDLTELNLLELV